MTQAVEHSEAMWAPRFGQKETPIGQRLRPPELGEPWRTPDGPDLTRLTEAPCALVYSVGVWISPSSNKCIFDVSAHTVA